MTKGNPRLSFRVPQEDIDEFEKQAKREGKDLYAWIRSLLYSAVASGAKRKDPFDK